MSQRKHYKITDSLSMARHQAVKTALRVEWEMAQDRGELRNGLFARGGPHKPKPKTKKFDRRNPED